VALEGLGTLRYDWHAIARLVDEFGKDFDSKLSAAARDFDIDVIARAVVIGLDNGATVDDVKRAAPPIVPTVAAVLDALNLAFHGQREALPADGDANPPRSKATSSAKRAAKRSAPA
jgi:hypothetical protein